MRDSEIQNAAARTAITVSKHGDDRAALKMSNIVAVIVKRIESRLMQ